MRSHRGKKKSSKDVESERYSGYSVCTLLSIHNHSKIPQEKFLSPRHFSVKSSVMPQLQFKVLGGGRARRLLLLKGEQLPPYILISKEIPQSKIPEFWNCKQNICIYTMNITLVIPVL